MARADTLPANRPRSAGKRFVKGQSGNPSGRPAVVRDFRERCREFMEDDGWNTLLDLATQHGRGQMPALTLIASYAYGKPTQAVEVSGPDGTDLPLRFVVEYVDSHAALPAATAPDAGDDQE